jgi:hypothetical protein
MKESMTGLRDSRACHVVDCVDAALLGELPQSLATRAELFIAGRVVNPSLSHFDGLPVCQFGRIGQQPPPDDIHGLQPV